MIGYHIKKFWRIYLGYNITKFLALKNHIMICYPLQDLDIKYPNSLRQRVKNSKIASSFQFLGHFSLSLHTFCLMGVDRILDYYSKLLHTFRVKRGWEDGLKSIPVRDAMWKFEFPAKVKGYRILIWYPFENAGYW